jgi:amino acid adenylation domain-containing protein
MSKLQINPESIPKEQLRIREKCYHPSKAFEKFKNEDIDQSIPDRFEQQVQLYSDRLAVKTEDQSLSYDALNKAANRIAHAILEASGERNVSIGLLFEHGLEMVTAFLGALKAGKICVPLDPSYPATLLGHILHDSQTNLILTNNKNLSFAVKLAQGRCSLLNIDEIGSKIPNNNLDLSIPSDAIYAIFYTSGSTGKSKGVVQNHRNLLYRIMGYTNAIHICKYDRLTGFQPFSFRAVEVQFFGALLNGAAFFPYDLKNKGIEHLADWLISEEITICYAITTSYRHFMATLNGDEDFPNLRLVKVGGETILKRDVEQYKKSLPHNCVFMHNYAPTEAGAARWNMIDKKTQLTSNIVPFGYKVEDTEILLLDDSGFKVGDNQKGEIAIKSRYLSPGYWQNPELTKAKFLPTRDGGDERIYLTGDLGRMQPDGCLIYLGRKDFQVKIRGFRVEVAEIEKALLDLHAVKEAAVIAREEEQSGSYRLIAYLVACRQPFPTVGELQRALRQKLPYYMIPSTFVELEAFPLTPTGKVDRHSLPVPSPVRPELESCFVAPRTPVEKTMAKIWSEILEIEPVGIHDKFIELGGNSLLATRIISRTFDTFKVKVALQSFLGATTIAEMALIITQCWLDSIDKEELFRILSNFEKLTDSDAKNLIKLK